MGAFFSVGGGRKGGGCIGLGILIYPVVWFHRINSAPYTSGHRFPTPLTIDICFISFL